VTASESQGDKAGTRASEGSEGESAIELVSAASCHVTTHHSNEAENARDDAEGDEHVRQTEDAEADLRLHHEDGGSKPAEL
jgi:hypothetical protein